jgi:signal transduction histidine kinase
VLTQAVARPTLSGAAAEEQVARYRQLEVRLEQVAQVAGRLAHDFSNVLTGILGFSELAMHQLPSESPPRRFVKEAWESARRGAEWIHKLHLFSRRVPNHPPATPLAPVAAAEQARVAPDWTPTVAFRLDIPEDLPSLAIPPDLLRNLLAELLNNARNAITGGGGVTLSARVCELDKADCRLLLGAAEPGRHVEISVLDSGCGLTAESFEATFATLLARGKPRQNGLGLAVVYGLARAHRGGLTLQPTAGPGTHLCVCLPAAPALD